VIPSTTRLKSIDILRALTMLLMIFVNDLWTLSGIPEWLGHKPAHEDAMGLADVVFPAFLFIVGLSIPHAIRSRFNKGQSVLLIMGLFMVNLENIDREHLLIGKQTWQILMTLGFFLIWNAYGGSVLKKVPPWIMKGVGWTLLVFLAVIFQGADRGDGYTWMRLYWWGILGLIGWGYLLSALVYLLLRNRPGWIALILAILFLLNINEFKTPFNGSIKLVVNASNYASVTCGMLVTSVMIRLQERERLHLLGPFLVLFATLLVAFGLLTRPLWGISKVMGTPSWTAICAAITALFFAVLHLVADRGRYTRWSRLIEPAGSSTLTCYLVPYFVYALGSMTGLGMPVLLTTGIPGILKSVIFSILIIQLTGLLQRVGIRLKI